MGSENETTTGAPSGTLALLVGGRDAGDARGERRQPEVETRDAPGGHRHRGGDRVGASPGRAAVASFVPARAGTT